MMAHRGTRSPAAVRVCHTDRVIARYHKTHAAVADRHDQQSHPGGVLVIPGPTLRILVFVTLGFRRLGYGPLFYEYVRVTVSLGRVIIKSIFSFVRIIFNVLYNI